MEVVLEVSQLQLSRSPAIVLLFHVGIMGFVSDTVLSEGGRAVGVIPSAMVKAGGEGKNAKLGDMKQPKSGYSETLSKMQREGVSHWDARQY